MTKTQQIRAAMRRDVAPQSADHWVRILFAGVLVAAAVYKYVTHAGPWQREDGFGAGLFLVAGLGVAFTGSVVTVMKAIPFPWKKSGNDPPPPAEAA